MNGLRYLLDTNVLSNPASPRPDPRILQHLRTHQAVIATATPVWHELYFGCRRLPDSRRRRDLERYLMTSVREAMPVLAYDTAAAEWHAAERARLTTLGRTPSFVDGQIAAIARVNELTLVTANLEDFLALDGLQVESWGS